MHLQVALWLLQMNFSTLVNSFSFPDYCLNSIAKLFTCYKEGPRLLRHYMENLKANTPPPLSAEIQERPDKNDAVEHFMTRYAKNDLVH